MKLLSALLRRGRREPGGLLRSSHQETAAQSAAGGFQGAIQLLTAGGFRGESIATVGISDRTRKLLWGRSGNRCALCRRLLVMPGTESDRESVVGDECHIVSRAEGGPRAGSADIDDADSYENLILLCKIDHKRVDDQPNAYTAERLRALKVAHETWVQAALDVTPPKTRSFDSRNDEGRSRVTRIESGGELIQIITGCGGFDFDHDELEDEAEVNLVGNFLQELQDLGDLLDLIEAGERVRTRHRLTQQLSELRELGFVVYGSRTRRAFVVHETKIPVDVAVIRVLKITNPSIWDPAVFQLFQERLAAERSAERPMHDQADAGSGEPSPQR